MATNVYGPQFSLTTGDFVLQGGDSISAKDTSTQMPMLVQLRWVRACELRTGGARGRWMNHAVSSTGVVAELARINTALGRCIPTKYIAVLGTADCILSTSVATFATNFNAILDAICGNGIPAYIATLTLVGEKAPTGANASDASLIEPYVAAMIAGQARYPALCTLRDMRRSVYDVQEPLLNTANATIGPLTRPDGTAAHFNAGGRSYCDAVISGDIQIIDAVARPVYSGPYPIAPGSLVSWKVGDSGDVGQTVDTANVTAWLDRIRQIATNPVGAFDGTITPATKPTFRTPAQAGKINGKSAVQSAGATYVQSASLLTATIPQPYMIAMVWQQVNLTGNQIISDTTPATSVNIPTINATGLLQPAAPTPYTPYPSPNVAATSWNCVVVVFNGTKSYVIFNGVRSNMGNVGANVIDRDFLFASATGPGGLAFTGMIRERRIYSSLAGPLPDARDVYQDLVNQYGVFPQ